MVATGNISGFWQSRYQAGDVWALSGVGIWSETAGNEARTLGNVSLRYMIGSEMTGHPNNPKSYTNRITGDTLRNIGIGLAQAHIGAIDASSGNGPLSFGEVARYHHTVFSRNGLRNTSYGGTPLFGRLMPEFEGRVLNSVVHFRGKC